MAVRERARGGRPFLVSYGGGHALILAALADEMKRRGLAFDMMGLTTAHATLLRAGHSALDTTAMVHLISESTMQEARRNTPAPDHPDISFEQACAYHAVGLADLVERFGRAEATERVSTLGRKAFEPVTVFRRFFEEMKPSVVVTTTSPRFEVASIKAARELGIPTIAVGDMYLIAEQEWIIGKTYADHLVVISEEVAALLRAAGPMDSQIHVLGNPAFDRLAPQPDDAASRKRLRQRFGWGDVTCILWPLGGSGDLVAGRALIPPIEVAAFLEQFCQSHPSFRYMLRPHPNWPVAPMDLAYGIVDAKLSLEEALLMTDVVCVEASTVGLQAVLKGIPTICVSFADYVLYPDFGWASAVETLDEMGSLLASGDYTRPPAALRDSIGGASGRVVDLIQAVAAGCP